jgi:hypothetical protein
MKKLFSFCIILFSSSLFAQDEYGKQKTASVVVDTPIAESEPVKEKSEFRKNLRLGGAFNIGSYSYQSGNVSSQLFFIQVSPQLTYKLTDYFEGGITSSYSYTGTFADINSHSYSLGPILRAYVLDQFFLQVEGVAFRNTTTFKGFLPYSTTNFNAFVGGGFVSKFSENSYMLTGVKINLLANQLTNNQNIPIAFTSIHFGF